MTTFHKGFNISKNWIFEKYPFLTHDFIIYNEDTVYDNNGNMWNVSKHTLDYYWLQYFNECGTCLQDTFIKKEEVVLPYCEYLRNTINTLAMNNIYGLIKVLSCEEDDVWKISTSTMSTTVLNCLRYTPYKLENKYITAEFIIYQIISAVEELHIANIPHLELTLDNLYIDENFVLKLSLPHLNSLSKRFKDFSINKSTIKEETTNDFQSLDDVLWKWMCGTISNLEYLLYLNKLAGRTECDPDNHCMIPWVTDFRKPYGGLRDLKLSKFRINKGDDHLNKIYQDQLEEIDHYENDCPMDTVLNRTLGCVTEISNKSRVPKGKTSITDGYPQSFEYQPSYPHHVSDILSELSYYAYMARVTPIEILKKSYRSFYNPQEFRWNMTKMYDWTPDECIPQFFTDPSVFRSMHSDMPDIELPHWCRNPEELVGYHREILESDEVSVELHHWIDLVFGYKLLGENAVLAKNVHRQFTDRSPKMTNNGLTVLFRTPHPKRLCCSPSLKKYFGPHRPLSNFEENSKNPSNDNLINLPDDYDPSEFLDFYKIYNTFIQDSCINEAIELKPTKKLQRSLLKITFEEDVISICCLIIEIFNFDKLRADYIFSSKNLSMRLDYCYLLYYEDSSKIPLKFRDSVEKIINICRKDIGRIPNIYELKKSEKWILFNKSTIKLYDLIKSIKYPNIDNCIAVKHFFRSPIENSKFHIETLNLLTPHLINLLKPNSNTQLDKVLDILVCITLRHGLITGKSYFIKEVLPHIVNLYPKQRDEIKSQHALLYQRTFLNLLLIRIGMLELLNHFIEYLVQMLVIGQNIFGSMKESITPELDNKINANDSDSLIDYETSSIWYIQNGDDDGDNIINNIGSNADGDMGKIELCSNFDPDSVSQSSVDTEETKSSSYKPNGFVINIQANVLDNLPLSDPEIYDENPIQPKISITQLLSPFRKPKQKSVPIKSSKIRSRQNMSQDCSKMSLAHLSCSSLIWLADLIGPVQATSRILCELLSQFLLCYQNSGFEEIPVDMIDDSKASFVTGTYDSCVHADFETTVIFDCFKEFIALYGTAIIDRQFRHFLDTLLDKTKFFSDDLGSDMEINLICSLSLLRFLGMIIPDDYLESFLTDKILDDYLPLIIKCIGNMSHPFPNGIKARKVLFHKTVDLLYLLSSRMKYDQIQQSMGDVFKLFFGLFNKTYVLDEKEKVIYRIVTFDIVSSTESSESSEYLINYLPDQNNFSILSTPRINNFSQSETPLMLERQAAFEEMKMVITSELIYVIYITFAKLLGQNKLKTLVCNHSLIQGLVSQFENDVSKSNNYKSPDKVKQQKLEDALQYLTSYVLGHKKRHLSQSWNQYWIHELGFCDSETFDIKQMCLGKFEGHTSGIKGFDVLNCENGFMSYGKDKIVKLFSCADIDYSNVQNEVVSKFSYIHLKPVSSAIFIEQMRMAVSLDGLVHMWDPFVGKKIYDSPLGVSVPNWSMVCSMPCAHFQVAVANTEGRVQILDLRSGSSTYSYNLNVHNNSSPPYGDFATSMGIPNGFIRQLAGAPNGNQLIIGNSEGYLTMVELRMSRVIQTLRPHQNEISQIKFIKNWCVTSSLEPNGKLHLFSLSNFNKNQTIHGPDLGSIHSLMMLRNEILVGASQNRFGLFTSVHQYKSLNRLSPILYKGTVTTASLLLHNNLLLLGNDTGNISLWY